jgi:DDE superfamily endonuclease
MQWRNRVRPCGFDGVESNVIGQWIRCRLEAGESAPECRFGEWMTGSVSRQLVPTRLAAWMQPFAAAFTAPSWQHVLVLIVGAILTPGRRTVAAALRVAGLENDPHFTNYHRVLNRNQWSSRWIARCLLRLLIDAFVPTGPVVIGLDDTLERRWGAKIKARGIYRDPVRSSESHLVKASGLRWLSLMLLPQIPWAGRVWALPFLTVLAPSERYARERQRRHKKLTDWGRQMLLQAARWLPGRRIIGVTDSSFAVIELLNAVRHRICMITRLRLDARLFDPPPHRHRGTKGRPRVVGKRQPTLAKRLNSRKTHWRRYRVTGWYGRSERLVEIVSETAIWYHPGSLVPIRYVLVRDVAEDLKPQAFLCTDLDADPLDILRWFVRRWSIEVTFAEVRRHLGVETQRQWSDPAIARTTPTLLGLFSLITLWAHELYGARPSTPRGASWYRKPLPTFSDALALVRRELWTGDNLQKSSQIQDVDKLPLTLFNRLINAACYAA